MITLATNLLKDMGDHGDCALDGSSGEESDQEQILDDFDTFCDSTVQPFSFEPMCSPEELIQRLASFVAEPTSAKTLDDKWCFCNVCEYIETEPQNKCCQSSELVREYTKKHSCITETEDFKLVCLHKTVLKTALGVWHHNHGDKQALTNKNFRFIAYRQYIGLMYGRLGSGNRIPIPSCVLRNICSEFPSPDNIYVPYHDA